MKFIMIIIEQLRPGGQHYPSFGQLGPEGQNHNEQLFLQVLFCACRSLLTLLKGMIVISTARHAR